MKFATAKYEGSLPAKFLVRTAVFGGGSISGPIPAGVSKKVLAPGVRACPRPFALPCMWRSGWSLLVLA
jgi:hypothetical protein